MPLLLRLVLTTLVAALIVATLLSAAIAFGGPKVPAPMASIHTPFKGMDLSALPALAEFRARDGTQLAYRRYAARGAQQGSVVLVHGSSASSQSLHPLAMTLAAAGQEVFALDMRGHGASGPKGRIAYVGQLDHDIDDFLDAVRPALPASLMGFSSGGGFALRYASGPSGERFQRYLLLAPFLSQDSPTQRPASGGWVSVGVPRIVALTVLNALGVHRFNHLTVTRFALDDDSRTRLTEAYDYNLATNFRPRPDFMAELRSVRRPTAIVVGAADEAFHADRFAAVVQAAAQTWPVRVVPGSGHIGLTLDDAARQAIVEQLQALPVPDQFGRAPS
ncbi:MAG: alpha/beta hydrolase [Hydrogenophaga sp.]|uniref:alpha/beta hydrolase n=1 Tax=Hydrogenophaga sp. TaxID=1904254 RepID=UPI001DF6A98D|nr:alpha/beta fold hydrolase [Hydrogenophaga sp.]MBX3610537.1 alpha/beta hydrolase [Hydrogenophaga sp.]